MIQGENEQTSSVKLLGGNVLAAPKVKSQVVHEKFDFQGGGGLPILE